MIVVDASVLVVALADDGRDGDQARARLGGQELAAPQVIDLEVTSVLRGQARVGALDQRRALQALQDLSDIPLHRAAHLPLLRRCWELRNNITQYHAAYVVLAEVLGVALLTGDRRLVTAPGPRCPVELFEPTG